MIERPTLYLDCLGAVGPARKRGELPEDGRLVCAMVRPHLSLLKGKGGKPAVLEETAPALHPKASDLGAVNCGQIAPEEYARRYAKVLAWRELGDIHCPQLAPGKLSGFKACAYHSRAKSLQERKPLGDGDVLVCTCARLGSPKRKHPFCHLEEAAWWLTFAGWDVVLYGRQRLSMVDGKVVDARHVGALAYEGPVDQATRDLFIAKSVELAEKQAAASRIPSGSRYPVGTPQWDKGTDFRGRS